MDEFLKAAIDEARWGLAEGGIPIGSVLVVGGEIMGRGHNQRIQKQNAILHAEMDCLANAGRLPARTLRRATLYSTLSPCHMCSGAILLYEIPRVVVRTNPICGADRPADSWGIAYRGPVHWSIRNRSAVRAPTSTPSQRKTHVGTARSNPIPDREPRDRTADQIGPAGARR